MNVAITHDVTWYEYRFRSDMIYPKDYNTSTKQKGICFKGQGYGLVLVPGQLNRRLGPRTKLLGPQG